MGAVDTDLANGDCVSRPARQPRQESLSGIDLGFLFGRRSWAVPVQAFEDAGHCDCPSRWKMWALGLEYQIDDVALNVRFAMSFNSDLASSLRENQELVEDLARYADGILTEKQVRQRWHLANDEVWTSLGTDESFVERVELEKTRRIRSGATKRELAQLRVVRAPEVLDQILSNERASPRHRIDAAKALDDLAGFAPQRPGVEQDRVVIKIDLSADTRAKGLEPNPDDVLVYEASARPVDAEGRFIDGTLGAPKQVELSQSELVLPRRGPGRPPGSRNKPKQVEHEPSSRGVPGFDVS